jgi:CheY-like chemotaxis protein
MQKKRDSAMPEAGRAKNAPSPALGNSAKDGGPDRPLKHVRILHVEDDPLVAKSVKRRIRKITKPENILHVESAEDALGILEKETFDLVLLDSRMSGMGGITMIEILAEKGKGDILDRIVMFSGTPFDLIANNKAFNAVGGRFLDKACEPEKIHGLLRWVAEGNKAKDWTPSEKNGENRA